MFNPSAVPNPNLNYQLPAGVSGGVGGPGGGGGGGGGNPDRDGDNRKLVYQWICELSWFVSFILFFLVYFFFQIYYYDLLILTVPTPAKRRC